MEPRPCRGRSSIGKTTLARSSGDRHGCSFKRIQFTPDLIPADLVGINFYNQRSGEFEFRPGPIDTQILLADEVNRATPRTQARCSRRWRRDR